MSKLSCAPSVRPEKTFKRTDAQLSSCVCAATKLQVVSRGQRRDVWATGFSHVFFSPSRKTLQKGCWFLFSLFLCFMHFPSQPIPDSLLPVTFPGNWAEMKTQRLPLPFSRWLRRERLIINFQLIGKYVLGETEVCLQPWNKLPSRPLPDVRQQPRENWCFFFVNAYHHLIFYKAEPGDNLVSTFGIVTAVKVTVTLQGHWI